jgi:hypothetical protein
MSAPAGAARLERLAHTLADLDPSMSAAERLEQLIHAGVDQLPRPGGGQTLLRWQALAAVAANDLSLAKLYEGHTDALAIFAELGVEPTRLEGCWGVWAAEAPQGRTLIEARGGTVADVRLRGAKRWCSGAAGASDALLTAWWADGRGPQLVSVDLRQPGVRVSPANGCAVGMAGSAPLDVAFDGAGARLVGDAGAYLMRPGFWQGGAGIAACWYGGTQVIADTLRAATLDGAASASQAFRLAALGRVDTALQATAALLREAAAWIDAHPSADASQVALRVRLCAEHTATLTLHEVGCALGATPFCRDARFARAAADLPVFVRQSHAALDLAALGERLLKAEASPWLL